MTKNTKNQLNRDGIIKKILLKTVTTTHRGAFSKDHMIDTMVFLNETGHVLHEMDFMLTSMLIPRHILEQARGQFVEMTFDMWMEIFDRTMIANRLIKDKKENASPLDFLELFTNIN